MAVSIWFSVVSWRFSAPPKLSGKLHSFFYSETILEFGVRSWWWCLDPFLNRESMKGHKKFVVYGSGTVFFSLSFLQVIFYLVRVWFLWFTMMVFCSGLAFDSLLLCLSVWHQRVIYRSSGYCYSVFEWHPMSLQWPWHVNVRLISHPSAVSEILFICDSVYMAYLCRIGSVTKLFVVASSSLQSSCQAWVFVHLCYCIFVAAMAMWCSFGLWWLILRCGCS